MSPLCAMTRRSSPPTCRDLISEFFQTGALDPNLTDETLFAYQRLARSALDNLAKATPAAIAEQSRRLDLIEEALNARGYGVCGD